MRGREYISPIRKHVQSVDYERGSAALRNAVRTMIHDDFMTLARTMYSTLHSGIENLQQQRSVILGLLSNTL